MGSPPKKRTRQSARRSQRGKNTRKNPLLIDIRPACCPVSPKSRHLATSDTKGNYDMRLATILIAVVAFFGPGLTACGITDNSQTTEPTIRAKANEPLPNAEIYAAPQITILLPPTTHLLTAAAIPPAPEFVLSPEDRRLAQAAAYPDPSIFSNGCLC